MTAFYDSIRYELVSATRLAAYEDECVMRPGKKLRPYGWKRAVSRQTEIELLPIATD
jgi:hypothetical protein